MTEQTRESLEAKDRVRQQAGLCSSAPAGSVSDPATLESIRNALNYLVYGAGRGRCSSKVYADAHYGLAMVEKAQRESREHTA